MEKTFTHSVYHVSNNEYYISEYEVLGTWDDTNENWEAFFKRTYPELSNKTGKILEGALSPFLTLNLILILCQCSP